MIARFYDDTLEELAASIAALRHCLKQYRSGEAYNKCTGRDAFLAVTGSRWRGFSATPDETEPIVPRELRGLSEYIIGELDRSNHSGPNTSTVGHKDLIETMTQLLQLPWGVCRISPKAYTALRKAILRPEEVQYFQAEVREQELHCYKCHQQLAHGEAITFVKLGVDGVVISCQVCTPATMSRCQCGKVKATSLAARRRGRKETACTCNVVVQPSESDAPPAPLPDDSL